MLRTRKSRAALSLIGALAASVLVAGCTSDTGGETSAEGETVETMDPITLRVSDPNPESSSNVTALKEWMEYVTAETDGKVEFETYFSGTLHSGVEGLSALEQGLTDITFFYPGYFADELPIANWVSKAFASRAGTGVPHTSLANSPATTKLYEESEDIRSELAQYNAIPLAVWGGPTFDLLCTKPVDSLASAEGVLVNTGGSPWIEETTALGMTPEFIEIPEEYEALQRGVINCATSNVSPLMTRGTWEVAKYYTPLDLSASVGVGYIFNKEIWESLPLEVQQIMHDGKQIIIAGYNQIATERFAEFAEGAPGMGVEVLDPAELNEALQEYHKENEPNIISSAPSTASDPQGLLDSFTSTIDDWQAILVDDLGIEKVEKTPENMIDLYLSVRDVPWDDYESAIKDSLAQYRPE